MWKRGEIAPQEQFLLFSTLFYVHISNFRSQISYSFVKCGCSIYCFPHSLNSDMSNPYLKCPQQVWHMLRTYADFRVNHCGSWRMSADVRYKSADVCASVKACRLLRTFFRISWGYLFADVRSSMQVSLRTSAKACVKFWLCIFLLRTCADILDLEKIRHWRKLHMSAKILADICGLLKYCHTHFEQ